MASDIALEIDAPGLRRANGKTQCTKRNRHLGAPAAVEDLSLHPPGAIPVSVEAAFAIVGDLTVVLRPRGIGTEDEAGLAVAIGIEDDLEAVGLVEGCVAACVGNDNAIRLAVVANDADVERIVVESDEDLRLLGGRLTFVGGGLHEAGGRGEVAPSRIRQNLAVKHRCRGQPTCREGRSTGRREGLLSRGRRGDEQQQRRAAAE